ncbi:MAG TPA: hypothetical protein VJT73_05560 [Polyangiaceae bacterium]|nr:hypothetical protein [Polyangiaceae bacterium]
MLFERTALSKKPEALIRKELTALREKMSWVYTAIAAFENSVRAFIEERLLEKVGATWWDTTVSTQIKADAEKRKMLVRSELLEDGSPG